MSAKEYLNNIKEEFIMMGWGNMMWGYGSGFGNSFLGNGNYWWVGLIGMALQLIFWIALIVIGVKVFRSFRTKASVGYYKNDNSMEVLRGRYAKGEIDSEEYHRLKQDLMS